MRHPQHRHHAMVACVCESLSPWDGVRRWMRAVGPGHEGSGQGGQGVLARRRRATRSCGERVRRLARAATAPPSEVRIVTARCKIHPTVIGPTHAHFTVRYVLRYSTVRYVFILNVDRLCMCVFCIF